MAGTRMARLPWMIRTLFFSPYKILPIAQENKYLMIFFSHFIMELYTERKKKRRVNFIPKFHSSLKKFVKYFTMITKRYMYGTKVQNFIGL